MNKIVLMIQRYFQSDFCKEIWAFGPYMPLIWARHVIIGICLQVSKKTLLTVKVQSMLCVP